MKACQASVPVAETLEEYNDRMNAMALSQWQEKTMPNVRILLQSKFITKEDITAPMPVTISQIVQDNQQQRGAAPDMKWLMYFAELRKGLRLNKTTIKQLAATFGDETDHWLGKRVRIYVDHTVEMAGQIVGGVRLQMPNIPPPSGALARPGAPTPAAAPAGARFDPMTGMPLGAPAPAPVKLPSETSFDPVPGEIAGAGVDAEFNDDIPF